MFVVTKIWVYNCSIAPTQIRNMSKLTDTFFHWLDQIRLDWNKNKMKRKHCPWFWGLCSKEIIGVTTEKWLGNCKVGYILILIASFPILKLFQDLFQFLCKTAILKATGTDTSLPVHNGNIIVSWYIGFAHANNRQCFYLDLCCWLREERCLEPFDCVLQELS